MPRAGRKDLCLRLLPAAAVILLSLLPVRAFVTEHTVAGGGHLYQGYRTFAVLEAWQNGLWSPRWSQILSGGRGYPLFTYYGWAPYGVTAALAPLSGSVTTATNLAHIFYALLLGTGAYLLGYEVTRRRAGAFACLVLYAYAPYQMVNLYVRSNYPEYAAGALAPWAMLGVLRTVRRTGRSGPVVALLSLSVLMFSHNISALLFYTLTGVAGLIASLAKESARLQATWRLGIVYLLALGTSAHFWLPLVLLRDAVQLERVYAGILSWQYHLLEAGQLFERSWGYGYSRPGTPDTMSFQLGSGFVTVLAISAGALRRRLLKRRLRRALYVLLSGVLLLAFLTTEHSRMIWIWAPPLQLIQFPWRLLLPIALIGAMAGSVIISYLLPRLIGRPAWRVWVSTGLLATCVVSSLPYTRPLKWIRLTDEQLRHHLQTSYITTTSHDDYLPLHAKDPGLRENARLPADWQPLSSLAGFRVPVPRRAPTGELVFSVWYYPGWIARSESGELPVRPESEMGFVAVNAPSGVDDVRLEWMPPTVARIADLVSLASGLAAFLLLWRFRRPIKH